MVVATQDNMEAAVMEVNMDMEEADMVDNMDMDTDMDMVDTEASEDNLTTLLSSSHSVHARSSQIKRINKINKTTIKSVLSYE